MQSNESFEDSLEVQGAFLTIRSLEEFLSSSDLSLNDTGKLEFQNMLSEGNSSDPQVFSIKRLSPMHEPKTLVTFNPTQPIAVVAPAPSSDVIWLKTTIYG
ncbi:MAG: hypothetical protein M3Q07_24485, partial [Pseudobdellovibrionaceae bacterium]|nr:hypothetical protein [Pseudobdellovibrionaceae bacterium]